jgi:nicotinamidase-related amidase
MTRGLLIVDVQNGLVDLNPASWSGVLDNIALLIENARGAGAPVVFVRHDSGPGQLLAAGTPAWELHRAVRPRPPEPVIEKRWSDSFAGTSLEATLRGAGVNTVVIAGAQTEYCIDTTVRRAASLGFDVILASDAHTTYDNAVLTREQTVAHHNEALPQLALVGRTIAAAPSRDILFAVPNPVAPRSLS